MTDLSCNHDQYATADPDTIVICAECNVVVPRPSDMDAGTICGVPYKDGVHIHADARCWPLSND